MSSMGTECRNSPTSSVKALNQDALQSPHVDEVYGKGSSAARGVVVPHSTGSGVGACPGRAWSGSGVFPWPCTATGIRQIFALSPQAKGRVERMASTFQDRLVTELRLAGVSTIDQANDVLQEFLPRFNARFAFAAEQPTRAYRPVPAELSLMAFSSWPFLAHSRA